MRRITISTFVVALGVALLMLPPALPAQGKSSALLEEIIVTARKREERLQDAPLAVSVFSGEALEFRGITSIDRLDQISPNLVINKSPTNSNVTNAAVYIRGIGQNDFVPVIDPGVGIYVDGVYLGRSVGAVLDIIDIERIEVLRGPQGTLFGRNTIGGAITLTTKKPDEEFAGRINAKFGTDTMVHLGGSLNLPITDTFFTRFSVASFQQDGYVIRVSDGKDLGNDDTIAARAAARWLASEDVEINVSFDYSRDRENGNPFVITGIQPLNLDLVAGGGTPSMVVAANTIAAQLASGGIVPDGEFFNPINPPTGFPFNFLACFEPNNATNPLCYNTRFIDDGSKSRNFGGDPVMQELDLWGAAVTIDWSINDNLDLKSITSYRTFDGDFTGDEDGSPVRVSFLIDTYEQDQFTQELQLLGTSFDDRLEWIIGGYYFTEDGDNINPVRFSQVDIQSGGFFKAQSWALFAQGTWSLTERLDLTVGLRYTDDERDYLPDQFVEALPIGPLPTGPGGVNCPPVPVGTACLPGDRVLPFEEVSRSTTETVPLVNLAYRWNDSLMTYFTYSEGFKSGGFTQRIFPPEENLPDFQPEFVESYEIGAKFDGWDDKLRANFAAFFTDYTDLQLLVADPSRVGPFVTNAGDVDVSGFELELFLTPAEGWFLTASVGLTDLDRTKLAGGVQGLTLDSRFEHISDWTANAQIYKEIAVGGGGYVTPRIEWSFRSEYGTNANNLPRNGADVPAAGPFAGVPLDFGIPNPPLIEDDLHLFHASIRWDVRDKGLALTVGVDNLTDEEFRVWGNQQDAFGFTQETFDRGRQWYVSAGYDF